MTDQTLQPWQFFVLAGLGCATAATFMARGQGITAVVLLSLLMAGAVFVGIAALRALLPLVTPQDDRTVMIGQRTRAALEREKQLSLRAIKELEFDHAMGKLSEEDFKEMSGRLRARAARLIRQLDAGSGYRDQIEHEVAKRLADADARLKPSRSGNPAVASGSASSVGDARSSEWNAKASADPSSRPAASSEWSAKASADPSSRSAASSEWSAKASAERLLCAACQTPNDADARFCKECGQSLAR